MNIQIYNTAILSLTIQFFIAIISLSGLYIKISEEDLILNKILLLETLVQFVEFLFYVWLVYNFSKIKINVTSIRYLDWFITTPTMLFSTISFFIYQTYKSNSDLVSLKNLSLLSIYNENTININKIIFYNTIMLLSGLLGEINITSKLFSFIVGFYGFINSYYLIYTNYVGDITINNLLFWFNFLLWSFYGIAYMFSFKNKNITYNILDIFSKNINGLFILAYIIYVKHYTN